MPRKIIVVLLILITLGTSLIASINAYRIKRKNSIAAITNQRFQTNYYKILEYNKFQLKYTRSYANDILVFKGNDSIHLFNISDLFDKDILVFSFSNEMCEACITFATKKLIEYFPDYVTNDRIVIIPVKLQPRFKENYYGKGVFSRVNKDQHLFNEIDKYPCYLILNKNLEIKHLFVPDPQMSEMTDLYLKSIKYRYFDE